jgi:hypothetical protein
MVHEVFYEIQTFKPVVGKYLSQGKQRSSHGRFGAQTQIR